MKCIALTDFLYKGKHVTAGAYVDVDSKDFDELSRKGLIATVPGSDMPVMHIASPKVKKKEKYDENKSKIGPDKDEPVKKEKKEKKSKKHWY